MNLLCPACQKMITVPDQYAGQTMKCPLCSQLFPAPVLPPANPLPPSVEPSPSSAGAAQTVALPPLEPAPAPRNPASSSSKEDIYTFASPPAQTPPYPRPGAETSARVRAEREAPASQPPTPPPPPGNYVQTRTIWISPRGVQWIAPVALGLVFLLMFFTWVWKPGPEEETQSGWGTGLGHNFTMLGFFYLIFFLIAFLVSLASVLVPRLDITLPDWARPLWPWRSAIVAGIAFLALMFFVLELLAGFGLEHAQGKELYYLVRRTFAVDLVFLLLLAAIAGALLEFWLVLRKSRPLPKIDISW